MSWRPWSLGSRGGLSLGALLLRGLAPLHTLASTQTGRDRGSSSFSGSGPGAGVEQVSLTQIPRPGPRKRAWLCDPDIPKFLKLSEEAARWSPAAGNREEGAQGAGRLCCRDGNGIRPQEDFCQRSSVYEDVSEVF